MLIDLHSHSTLSDGTLSIEEMVAAAERRGYQAYAVTDHVDADNSEYRDLVRTVRAEIDRLRPHTRVQLFSGAELSHFPPEEIDRVAAEVRACGAQVVVVHGECVSMPVRPGTNAAAVRSSQVDILGHPGLIDEADAEEAARRGVFLELSARAGHCWGNGHVLSVARRTGASLVVDSDAHGEDGLLSTTSVNAVIRGAGASEVEVREIVDQLAPTLVERLRRRVLTAS